MPNGAKRCCLAARLEQRSYMWHQWEPEKKTAGCMTAGQSSGSRRPRPDGKAWDSTVEAKAEEGQGLELHEKGEGCPPKG
ncbi:hypothetical protein LY76DRAFT_591849 [Colletotrichum caudatum]|nr:hypothetical protein LY76DRAFT_591849 [Colletotrichum caudatum]